MPIPKKDVVANLKTKLIPINIALPKKSSSPKKVSNNNPEV